MVLLGTFRRIKFTVGLTLHSYSDGYLDDAEAESSQHGSRVGVKADFMEYHRRIVEHGRLTCQLPVYHDTISIT